MLRPLRPAGREGLGLLPHRSSHIGCHRRCAPCWWCVLGVALAVSALWARRWLPGGSLLSGLKLVLGCSAFAIRERHVSMLI